MPCEVGETWYRERDGQLFKCVESYIGPPTWWRPIDCEQEGARKSDDSGRLCGNQTGVAATSRCLADDPCSGRLPQAGSNTYA